MAGGNNGRPLNRRGFLTVGAIGFGLSMGDFLKMRARAEQKNYGFRDEQQAIKRTARDF